MPSRQSLSRESDDLDEGQIVSRNDWFHPLHDNFGLE